MTPRYYYPDANQNCIFLGQFAQCDLYFHIDSVRLAVIRPAFTLGLGVIAEIYHFNLDYFDSEYDQYRSEYRTESEKRIYCAFLAFII